jgi:transaldolase
MDLFLDSADDAAWAELMPTGLFRGITTNPLLARRAGLNYPHIDWHAKAARARELGAQELHGQVFGPIESYVDWVGTLYEAGRAAGIRTVAKVPLTEPAMRAVPEIKKLDGPVLLTAAYHPKQICVALALGAEYIAPYFGRMADAGLPAVAYMSQMQFISAANDHATRILVASLRNATQVAELAALGLDCFTMSPSVAVDLLSDPNTEQAAAAFEAAARGET